MFRILDWMKPAFWRSDRWFLRIFLVACALAVAYNFTILLGFGPDEPLHMNYVRLLLQGHLPVIVNTAPNQYHTTENAHGYHPPLYYALLLPFYVLSSWMPGDSEWHFIRLVSGTLCLAALPLVYDLAFIASNRHRNIARITTATLAFAPIWGMIAGVINNDSAALFFTTLFLWLLLVKWREQRDLKTQLLLGLVLGLGALCKITVLMCGGTALFVALWARGELKNTFAWRGVLATSFLGALLVSPWHIRSLILYGTWTPLPPAAPWFHPPLHGLELLMHPETPHLLMLCVWAIFYTLWSQRDWLLQHSTLPAGQLENTQLAIYLVLAAFCALAWVGNVRRRLRKIDRSQDSIEAKTARYALYAVFIVSFLIVLQVALTLHQGWAEGGRYLLPALAGLALFLGRGWEALFGSKTRFFGAFWAAALLMLNVVSIYWLLAYLNPTYGPH